MPPILKPLAQGRKVPEMLRAVVYGRLQAKRLHSSLLDSSVLNVPDHMWVGSIQVPTCIFPNISGYILVPDWM